MSIVYLFVLCALCFAVGAFPLRAGSGQHGRAGAGALTVDYLAARCRDEARGDDPVRGREHDADDVEPAWPVRDPDATGGHERPGRVEIFGLGALGVHLGEDFPVPERRMTATGRHHLRGPVAAS